MRRQPIILRPDGTPADEEFAHKLEQPPFVGGRMTVVAFWLTPGWRQVVTSCRHAERSEVYPRDDEDHDIEDISRQVDLMKNDVNRALLRVHLKTPGTVAELCACEPDSPRLAS